MFDVFFFLGPTLTTIETNLKVSKTSRLLVLMLLYMAQYRRREDVLSNEWRGITKDCSYFFFFFYNPGLPSIHNLLVMTDTSPPQNFFLMNTL